MRREVCNGLTVEAVLGCYSCTRSPAAHKFRRATRHAILDNIHAVWHDHVGLAAPPQLIRIDVIRRP